MTPIGTKCKIITEPFSRSSPPKHSGHEFQLGSIIYIINHDGDDPDASMTAEYADGSDYWYINENDIEVIQ